MIIVYRLLPTADLHHPYPSIPLRTPRSPLPSLTPNQPLPRQPDEQKTHIKSQPIRLGRKGNLGSLGEIKHIPRLSLHFLPGLIGDLEFALEDNLHLIVAVAVDQGSAFFKTVEAARDGFFGVVFVAVVVSSC